MDTMKPKPQRSGSFLQEVAAIRPGAEPLREVEASGEEPPESHRRLSADPPPALSRFALRDDGALLLSIEDANDRDLAGREIVTFFVLTSDEAAVARRIADDGISAAAALVIGRLPKGKR